MNKLSFYCWSINLPKIYDARFVGLEVCAVGEYGFWELILCRWNLILNKMNKTVSSEMVVA
jgi:hypothetical protein